MIGGSAGNRDLLLNGMNKQRKLKIIYAITKSVYGGAGKYVLELATSLPKDRFEVVVLLGGSGALKEKLESEGIRTISLSLLEKNIDLENDVKSFNEILEIFRKEKPDVIHLNSSKIGGIGALAARVSGIPKIIFTAHGWPFNENRNPLSKVAIWIVSWITVLLSTKTIVIDEHDLRQGRRLPFCRQKFTLIHNGINSFEYLEKDAARDYLVQKLEKDPFLGRISIGTIAELTENKGINYGIEAISLLAPAIKKKISYIVIGEGENRKKLENLISEKKLTDRVFLPGFMENAKQYLSAFDIFMLPSLKEGLPYVLLEAGYVGLPIITTKVGGIPDIVGEEKTDFLVKSRRSDALANAMTELIVNKKVRTALRKKIKDNVVVRFNFEMMQRKTIKVYEK
ncbi:MAG: putative membrane protein [Parcubacteria group bacterium GW2011_GWF2_38_76]|nr:MAG: putative membrane protein [Parcubacteria group bacterium GW2011_GWF2_38_76]